MMSFLRSVATIPRAASATPTEISLHSFSSTKPQTFPFPSSHRSSPRLRWGYTRIFARSPMACVPQVSATAVSEFKGPNIFGVVRFVQISMEIVRIEASFGGLSPGKHSWCINEYGDLTKGAASTGNIYNPLQDDQTATQLPGDLGTLEADQNGEALYTVTKEKMKVTDLIGRAVVVYETVDRSLQGITAAVVARSGEVGESCRKLCSCDGTTVWEATVY
ncbi:PREDICTED: copper chaperone for superoxide dismutase, chloroplastic/cytosolic-like isoform X1 [Brassica oleracea var. oleracea]|uniref:Superoxide dismutase copper/zinc binding domain-containing protein n=1 Tax=Brassica oleracea var. oleracea TaxID=109376 RepID=A0A0D3E3S9_BRAOL|nr:PREDICTED: copper chaperone for superoxide dismutase, chloroplastic/cytosolic-like isoform X1 [Brassica oleracea var. oleracea]